jgi:hypothetical protein
MSHGVRSQKSWGVDDDFCRPGKAEPVGRKGWFGVCNFDDGTTTAYEGKKSQAEEYWEPLALATDNQTTGGQEEMD